MSDRSTISIINEDGTVETIYCHDGGSVNCNGKKLQEHYNTHEAVKSLISLGSLSYLGIQQNPDPDFIHHFFDPQPNVTIAYDRDRKGRQPIRWGCHYHKNLRTFKLMFIKFAEEDNYLFKDGNWYHCEGGGDFEILK